MSRDVLQAVSLGLSVLMLAIVARKVWRRPSSWRMWTPFLLVSTLTAAFYILVLTDVLGAASSDLSSTLRLVTQMALLAYAYYMPPCGDGKRDAD